MAQQAGGQGGGGGPGHGEREWQKKEVGRGGRRRGPASSVCAAHRCPHKAYLLAGARPTTRASGMSANPPLTQMPDGALAPTPYEGEQVVLGRGGVRLIIDGVRTPSTK